MDAAVPSGPGLEEVDVGRPPKHDLEKRSVQLDARYTQLEADFVQEQADAAGISRAAYIRKRTLGERIVVPQMRGIDPALIIKLDQLIQEINAMGNNANQIARSVNSGRRLPPGTEAIGVAIAEMRDKVISTLDEVVKGDGP